jgi:hypothetical protein
MTLAPECQTCYLKKSIVNFNLYLACSKLKQKQGFEEI